MTDFRSVKKTGRDGVLFVNCCVRGAASRTLALAKILLGALSDEYFSIDEINLMNERDLAPLNAETLARRDELLSAGDYGSPVFRRARAFAEADVVVIAAPFWDLTFPSLLKVYIEDISVEKISFDVGEQGLLGLCRGRDLVYVTTRGGIYRDSELEQGSREMGALREFYGFGRYVCVAVEGTDVPGACDYDDGANRARREAERLNAEAALLRSRG